MKFPFHLSRMDADLPELANQFIQKNFNESFHEVLIDCVHVYG